MMVLISLPVREQRRGLGAQLLLVSYWPGERGGESWLAAAIALGAALACARPEVCVRACVVAAMVQQ